MSDTYAIFLQPEACWTAVDTTLPLAMIPLSVWTAQPIVRYAEVPSLLAIYNPEDSGVVVRVSDLALHTLDTGGAVAGTWYNSLLVPSRITAMSGGTPLAVVPFDASNPSLPSQVSVVWRPGTITRVANSTLRRVFSEQQPYAAQTWVPHHVKRPGKRPYNSSQVLDGWDSSDTQRQVLREGEGLIVECTNPSAPPPFTDCGSQIHFSVVFRNVADGSTYTVNKSLSPHLWLTNGFFGIFNGVGSGVVLEVVSIEATDTGLYYSFAYGYQFDVTTFSNLFGGEAVPVVPLDSASPSFPSAVKVMQRATVLHVGLDHPMPSRASVRGDAFIRRWPAVPMSFSNAAFTMPSQLPSAGLREWNNLLRAVPSGNDSQEYVLRPGEGLCVLARSTQPSVVQWYFSPPNRYAINALLTYEDIPAASSGGFAPMGTYAA